MDQTSKQKKQTRRVNVLESLKELGDGSAKDFARQLLGPDFIPQSRHFSGEIFPDQQLEINDVLTGNAEKEQKLQQQLLLERQLRDEEKALFNKKSQELKLTLAVLTQELQKIAQATPKLAQEVQIAVMQAPVNPGVYHVFFFQRLIEFAQGYRHKIEETTIWLSAVNCRAAKKTFWGQYKAHGGRRLLSAEDYSQRAAG